MNWIDLDLSRPCRYWCFLASFRPVMVFSCKFGLVLIFSSKFSIGGVVFRRFFDQYCCFPASFLLVLVCSVSFRPVIMFSFDQWWCFPVIFLPVWYFVVSFVSVLVFSSMIQPDSLFVSAILASFDVYGWAGFSCVSADLDIFGQFGIISVGSAFFFSGLVLFGWFIVVAPVLTVF